MKTDSPLGAHHRRRYHFWPYLLLLTCCLLVVACSDRSEQDEAIDDGTGPVVTITSPIDGEMLLLDSETTVLSTSVNQRAVTRVELIINDAVQRIDANADPVPDTPFIVAQPWTPETLGRHTIKVRAYNTANVYGESETVTVEVVAQLPAPEIAQAAADTPTPEPTPAALPTNTPTDEPTPAPLSTNTPIPTPTPEPTPEPLPTIAPTNTPAEPTPIPLPTATFAPTGLEASGRFQEIWQELGAGDGPLGFPLAPQIEGRDYAKQGFENGLMYWWDNPEGADRIWILTDAADHFQSGDSWRSTVDTWEGDETYSCPAARENGGPVRGFGKAWCDNPDLADRLGKPVEQEAGSGGNAPYSQVQFFQGGVMLYNPLDATVYVLLDNDGWLKFIS